MIISSFAECTTRWQERHCSAEITEPPSKCLTRPPAIFNATLRRHIIIICQTVQSI
jgi:hypothetical protein